MQDAFPVTLHPSHPVLSKARLYPAFLQDGRDFACMLVLPGGGYSHVSHQEGAPVAAWLNSIGISALVLEYRVSSDPAEGIYPQPQQQALYALRFLRAQATALNIDPHRIGVIGFRQEGIWQRVVRKPLTIRITYWIQMLHWRGCRRVPMLPFCAIL